MKAKTEAKPAQQDKTASEVVDVTVTLPIEPCDLRHGFRMDLEIRHEDACVLHGIRRAMEKRGERLRSGTGRLVNSNADTVRRIMEIIGDKYRDSVK